MNIQIGTLSSLLCICKRWCSLSYSILIYFVSTIWPIFLMIFFLKIIYLLLLLFILYYLSCMFSSISFQLNSSSRQYRSQCETVYNILNID